MFNSLDSLSGVARIKVIGVGGAGNNAVNRMIEAGIQSASYVAVNTDKQILLLSKAENKIQIGSTLTKGLGAGAEPEVGRAAAEESKEVLTEAVKDTDLLFITAGMGGGTGTGAAPVIAKIARDLKILTIAIVTEPFNFEGKKRMDNTAKGLENLKKYVDTLIIIPNDKITSVVPKNTPMVEALRVADEILKQGIRGIADLIVNPALINLDFADVRTILKDQGLAHMGVGVAKGENRIVEAVRLAVNCPLLETTIEGAKGVILNIVGGNDLTMDEVQTAATLVQSVVDYSANIIFGACIDSNINDEVEVTVIATGFPHIENMYNPKDERNVASRNFFVNRGLPERNADEAPAQPAAPVQSASPSYVRMPLNNTMAGQQPPVYKQPYQQQVRQPQYEQEPQYQQQPAQPQYQQPQYAQQPAQPQYQPQPQYQQATRPAPQQPYAQQGMQAPRQTAGTDADKELPTFVQRLFRKK
ncbi:MAG: cell division protein FtsZ [Bacillota bacterium]|nr:MAG: cell division protein FtsZ [Bacillota bacterium]